MSPKEPASWQAYLGTIITHPKERARLAEAIHVRPITLQRWVQGVSRPRDEKLRLLVKHIPRECYALFMRLLLADNPTFLEQEIAEESRAQKLPAEFYARLLSMRALTPLSVARQSMQDLLLQQMLQHLDPNRHGLAVRLVICVPPRPGQKVRSLHDIGGLGTPPWPYHLMERPLFLGTESLVGYAVSRTRSCVVNSRFDSPLYPVQWAEQELSSAACPILLHSRVVGGLLLASAREDTFTPSCLTLLEAYAQLASCLFEPEEAFAPTEICLQMMPAYTSQHPYFAGYQRRISRLLIEAHAQGQLLNMQQARQLTWQDLEDTVLQISTSAGTEQIPQASERKAGYQYGDFTDSL